MAVCGLIDNLAAGSLSTLISSCSESNSDFLSRQHGLRSNDRETEAWPEEKVERTYIWRR